MTAAGLTLLLAAQLLARRRRTALATQRGPLLAALLGASLELRPVTGQSLSPAPAAPWCTVAVVLPIAATVAAVVTRWCGMPCSASTAEAAGAGLVLVAPGSRAITARSARTGRVSR